MNDEQSINRLIGEIHGIVKSHDVTLRNIESQTQNVDKRVTSLERTTEMLAKVESSNSGLIKVNQDSISANRERIEKVNEVTKNLGHNIQLFRDENAKLFEAVRSEIADMKTELNPMVGVFSNVRGINRAIMYLLGLVLLVGGAIGVVFNWIGK